MNLLNIIWNIWLELSPWMLFGALVAGLMHVLIPEGWIKRQLSGRMGVLKAVVIGVPLPLCSCGVIPVGLGLKKTGASNGATVGFLISTPQTGVDSILVSAAFLGWPFAILKVAVALLTGLIGGSLTGSDSDTPSVTDQSSDESSCCSNKPQPRRLSAIFTHGLQLIRSIWRWLLAGVFVSALLTWWNPSELLAQQPFLTGFPALLMTLLIALPLYVCATASVPIAAALVASGFPPGAALVFLMAGPATNLATLGAIYRTLGRRALSAYLSTIVVGSLIAGMLFNSLIAVDDSLLRHQHDHTAWWATASGIILAVIIAGLAATEIRNRFRKPSPQPTTADDTVFVQLGSPMKSQTVEN